ncbi:hypothetical protein K435DRAFT_852576 [Dendrothele bispora CBS 962.96]|uniref:Uncharacterized protein n=1 Tax=Dendrothele bispora (strain CBS 962.96) TaxID=1314807 RepID=A0A4V4HHH7_DENBC|nr:hypothetical protein K435DRAFT_852576 [Dendrothele bispora CBS 962.96]
MSASSNDVDIEECSYKHHDHRPIQLTPDQYEKLFLQPGGRAPTGTLMYRFGNPTPLPILGNTFPFVVFTSFGAYWLSLAALQDPIHAIASAYTDGIAAVPYNKGLMFYFIFWTVTVTIYFVGSLRTNFVFVIIFFTLILTFAFFAAAYGQLGNGNLELAQTLLKAAGACAFANICVAWYLVTSLIMRIVEMPFTLPVGDLSGFWRSGL